MTEVLESEQFAFQIVKRIQTPFDDDWLFEIRHAEFSEARDLRQRPDAPVHKTGLRYQLAASPKAIVRGHRWFGESGFQPRERLHSSANSLVGLLKWPKPQPGCNLS